MRKAVFPKVLELAVLGMGVVLISVVILWPGVLKKLAGDDRERETGVTLGQVDDLAWWDNIGGCGVSGASGGSGGGAKWVGRGVTGGLVDMELMRSVTMGGDYQYKSLSARFSYKLMNKNMFGVSFPFSTKMGTYQYDNNESPTSQMIGGFGNLGLDYTRKFGQTESGSATMALGTPTGRYDHRRVDHGLAFISAGIKDTTKSLVTPELQPGNGLYSLSLSSEYTIDKDWGPIIFGLSYSANFRELNDLASTGAQNDVWIKDDYEHLNADLGGKTVSGNMGILYPPPLMKDFGTDTAAYQAALQKWQTDVQPIENEDRTVNRNHYTRDKNGAKGEKLIGDFFGNSVSANVAVGLKQENCVHSIAFSYSYKLAMDWYVRREDTDIAKYKELDVSTLLEEIPILPVESGNRHTFSLSYGLEISSMYFPVFLAGTMTFSEKELQNFGGTIGVKGSFF